ncbi:MAG: TetR/AcrR family transcriptional regulator [Chloroflexota bacterium]|nr:TetR/AcrR family transcriptional regulator [Chloroflexota bacterium]
MESERKIQILDTAERLFSERGYQATSMRDLARELDLKGGSLYSHISSKEELLWRIVERAADEFLGAVQPLVERDDDPVERLRDAIHAHVRVVTDNLDAATVYFHEWRFLSEPRRSEFLERRNHYEQLMRGLVADAVASGEFVQVDPKWATLLILSAVNWLYHWYNPDGPLSADEIADRFIEMIFHGLQQPLPV